jgi:hypothetical protein
MHGRLLTLFFSRWILASQIGPNPSAWKWSVRFANEHVGFVTLCLISVIIQPDVTFPSLFEVHHSSTTSLFQRHVGPSPTCHRYRPWTADAMSLVCYACDVRKKRSSHGQIGGGAFVLMFPSVPESGHCLGRPYHFLSLSCKWKLHCWQKGAVIFSNIRPIEGEGSQGI